MHEERAHAAQKSDAKSQLAEPTGGSETTVGGFLCQSIRSLVIYWN